MAYAPRRSPTWSGRRWNGVAVRPCMSAARRMASLLFTLSVATNCACYANCSGIQRAPSCSRRSAVGVTADAVNRLVKRIGERAGFRLPGPRPHAPPRLRLRAGQQGARQPGHPGLARAPVDHQHRGLYGVGAEPFQGFLAGLTLWFAGTAPVVEGVEDGATSAMVQ